MKIKQSKISEVCLYTPEMVQDQAKDVYTQGQAERFDADFTIMTETLRGLLKDLFKTFKA